jgi:adenylate cyclase
MKKFSTIFLYYLIQTNIKIMNLTFQQQLDRKLLRSERKRVIILISIFLFAMGSRVLDVFFFKMDEENRMLQSFSTAWLFPFILVLFELLSLLYINKRLRGNKTNISMTMQYVNTVLEICLPSLIMLVVAKQYPSFDVLKSPALNIYFIFIILSTLRLNFWLSFFYGLLSAVSYTLISALIYGHFTTEDSARSAIFILSGVAAGFVAKQIREGANTSLAEAEKRNRVENLFGQQISKEVVDEMLQNGGMAKSKLMEVSIMFIDIRNFTKYAAGKPPAEIVKYQNAFFSIVVNVVSKHHGIVNQFLGDGCMVTFGAPLALDNPGQYAVNAALEILEKVNREISNENIPFTSVGIGIHSGDAVTGNVGNNKRQQYSITGNVVILASRIEQLNKEFKSQILVSKEVMDGIVIEQTEAELLGPVSLKGYDNELIIYKVA